MARKVIFRRLGDEKTQWASIQIVDSKMTEEIEALGIPA